MDGLVVAPHNDPVNFTFSAGSIRNIGADNCTAPLPNQYA